MLVVNEETGCKRRGDIAKISWGRKIVSGFDIALVEIVIGRGGDCREFDGAEPRAAFGAIVMSSAGEGAFGSDIEAKLEIVTDVVGGALPAVGQFHCYCKSGSVMAGWVDFWFVVIADAPSAIASTYCHC